MFEKIITLQKIMNVSNGEMAKACGISYGSFNNRKAGNDNFTMNNYKNAIAYFKKTLSDKIEILEKLEFKD